VVILLLIDRRGIETIGIATLINRRITIILLLPMSNRRYQMIGIKVASGPPDESDPAGVLKPDSAKFVRNLSLTTLGEWVCEAL
jgi:hypothetical protein